MNFHARLLVTLAACVGFASNEATSTPIDPAVVAADVPASQVGDADASTSTSTPRYVPTMPFSGTLVLPHPAARRVDGGVWFDVAHTPDDGRALRGKRVWLAFDPHVPGLVTRMARATVDVAFTDDVRAEAKNGAIYPARVDGWRAVSALETRAAARPGNELFVGLARARVVVGNAAETTTLFIDEDPTEIAGSHMALVRFTSSADAARGVVDVVHHARSTTTAMGALEITFAAVPARHRFVPVTTLAAGGSRQTSLVDIERTSENARGYFAFGRFDNVNVDARPDDDFVIHGIVPFETHSVQATDARVGVVAAKKFLRDESWASLDTHPRDTKRVQLVSVPSEGGAAPVTSRNVAIWREGEKHLVVHLFGTTGGENGEPMPWRALSAGHFSLGIATVVRDPFTKSLRFDVVYHQLYGGNADGIVAGRQHWSTYMGGLARGWMYRRPVSDMVVRHSALVARTIDGRPFDPLHFFSGELDVMSARWRSGDGGGGVIIDPASNCVQDAMQALFISVRRYESEILGSTSFQSLAADDETRVAHLQFSSLLHRVESKAIPLGALRHDWQSSASLAVIEEQRARGLRSAARTLVTLNTMMPRATHDLLGEIAIEEGASLFIVRTNLLGGHIDGIEPVAPKSILRRH